MLARTAWLADPLGVLLPAIIATMTAKKTFTYFDDLETTQSDDEFVLNCAKVGFVDLINKTLQSCTEVKS